MGENILEFGKNLTPDIRASRGVAPGLARIRALVKMASDGPSMDQIDREIDEYEALTAPTGGWYSINAAGFRVINCAASKNRPLLNSETSS